MSKYVKVKGYDNWFLMLSPNEQIPTGINEIVQERMITTVFHNSKGLQEGDFRSRLDVLSRNPINYEYAVEKYGTILIRPIGSYMLLRHGEIIEERESNYFPIDSCSDIVICENGVEAEPEWIGYLNKRFPDKELTTINFFKTRSNEEISEYFKIAKYVTFSTTFTSYEWFIKLTKNLKSHNKVIGYCHIDEEWNQALIINNNVEVIKSLDNE